MKPCFCSELTMKDIKEMVDNMNPLRVYVDDKIAWDEDNDGLTKYELLFKLDLVVTEVKFKIVDFHHTYITIKTKY